jgi:hypothetical protein
MAFERLRGEEAALSWRAEDDRMAAERRKRSARAAQAELRKMRWEPLAGTDGAEYRGGGGNAGRLFSVLYRGPKEGRPGGAAAGAPARTASSHLRAAQLLTRAEGMRSQRTASRILLAGSTTSTDSPAARCAEQTLRGADGSPPWKARPARLQSASSAAASSLFADGPSTPPLSPGRRKSLLSTSSRAAPGDLIPTTAALEIEERRAWHAGQVAAAVAEEVAARVAAETAKLYYKVRSVFAALRPSRYAARCLCTNTHHGA